MEDVNIFPAIVEDILFNKCLFKVIPLYCLKSELKRKNITFSAVDSYHILTVKLRKKLLEESNADSALIKPLTDEIDYFHFSQRKEKAFTCSLIGCPFQARNHRLYLKHLRDLHQNSNLKLACKLNGCPSEFNGINMLQIHIKRAHRSRESLVKIGQRSMVEQMVQLRCSSVSCNHQTVQNIKELKRHLKNHLEKFEMVACIFLGCDFETNVAGTFRGHLSRKHKSQEMDDLKAGIVLGGPTHSANEDIEFSRDPALSEEELHPVDSSWSEDDLDLDGDEGAYYEQGYDNQVDCFIKAIAIKFVDWMNIKNVPYSTCNIIIKEVFNAYAEGKKASSTNIRKLLQDVDVDDILIEQILRKVAEDDPFDQARSVLESEEKRLNYVKETFDHIEPETVYLNKENSESYQYISIIKSLKVLLEDKTFINQKQTDGYFPEESVYKDVRDGEYLKNNPYFISNPEAVPILLFQDELEVREGLNQNLNKIGGTFHRGLIFFCLFRNFKKILPRKMCRYPARSTAG